MADPTRRLLDERAALAGVVIPEDLSFRLLAYYALLMRWNRKINLTALPDSAAAIDRLLLEPLAAAKLLPRGAGLADLGSGGGSPALPLALALGSPQLLMVEARTRKAAFLREAAREVGQVAVVEALRFEELTASGRHAGTADVVSARAVRADQATRDLAEHLLKARGVFAVFLSQSQTLPATSLPVVADSPLIGEARLILYRSVPRETQD